MLHAHNKIIDFNKLLYLRRYSNNHIINLEYQASLIGNIPSNGYAATTYSSKKSPSKGQDYTIINKTNSAAVRLGHLPKVV
jgi:hypothetical protein